MSILRGSVRRAFSMVVVAFFAAGCGSGDPPTSTATASGTAASVAPSPESPLSAIISLSAPGATFARVISAAAAETLATPYKPVSPLGTATIAVLGLAPSTSYQHTVEVVSQGMAGALAPVTATTGPLPADIAGLRMQITPVSGTPEPGYYLVCGAGNATFAVDETGAVRWVRDFGEPTQEAKMQEDGTFTTYVGTSLGFNVPAPGMYIRYRGDGTEIGTLAAPPTDPTENDAPLITDSHELLLTTDTDGVDHAHLFAYLQRLSDPSATVSSSWHEILRIAPDGAVEFRWKSWTHFTPDDNDEAKTGDPDHPNAIAIDPRDGNYVVSFRSTDAILKIGYGTGDVLWQLGGKGNQFAFVGDALGGFSGQHSVRILEDGDVLIYDDGNLHSPQESRAVEYRLDTVSMTATMVWEFRRDPPLFTPYVGSVERLENRDTLVAFAALGIVDEVDPAGKVVWEGQLLNGGNPQAAYRIRRLASLYQYEAP